MKRRFRRPTSQNHCFQGAKTTFRLHERQKASCEDPKCIIFHHNNEALEKTIKNKPFPPLAAAAEARRTLGNAYLCMVSESDRSPPVAAAVKKKKKLRNAREPSRYRAWANTQNHHKVSTFRPRKSHTLPLKSPPGPLFRPIPCKNAVRVATSHTPPSALAQKSQKCTKAPPQAPSPRTTHSAREVSQKRARGAGGWELCTH